MAIEFKTLRCTSELHLQPGDTLVYHNETIVGVLPQGGVPTSNAKAKSTPKKGGASTDVPLALVERIDGLKFHRGGEGRQLALRIVKLLSDGSAKRAYDIGTAFNLATTDRKRRYQIHSTVHKLMDGNIVRILPADKDKTIPAYELTPAVKKEVS